MADPRVVLLHLLHGVEDPLRLPDHVASFRRMAAELVAGESDLFVGDAIEKGQTGPDRRSDLSGAPVFLTITPLTASHTLSGNTGALLTAMEHASAGASKHEMWVLREQFERHSSKAVARPRDDWLQIVLMNVDDSIEGEFNEWYEREHVERIAAVAPEFVSVRRMEAIVGSPRYAALWRMTDCKAPERDPWLSASETPWTTRIRRFMRDRRRLLLAPYMTRR
jgi:hypothetical protein